MAPKRLSETEKQQIAERYRRPEESTSTLARTFGVSTSTIGRLLKSSFSPEEYETLVRQKRTIGRGGAARAAKLSGQVASHQPAETPSEPSVEPPITEPDVPQELATNVAPDSELDSGPSAAADRVKTPETNETNTVSTVDRPKRKTRTRTRSRRTVQPAPTESVEVAPTTEAATEDAAAQLGLQLTDRATSEDLSATAIGSKVADDSAVEGRSPRRRRRRSAARRAPSTTAAEPEIEIREMTSSSRSVDGSESDEAVETVEKTGTRRRRTRCSSRSRMAPEPTVVESLPEVKVPVAAEAIEPETHTEPSSVAYEADSVGDFDIPGMLPVLSAPPLSEATLPKICYLVVDRSSELIARPLQEFGELGEIPQGEDGEQTLPVFDNHRVARRFANRSQRVMKIPDSRVLQKTGSHLQAKGITRILIDGKVYSL